MPIITRSRRHQDIDPTDTTGAEGFNASFDNTRRDLNQSEFINSGSSDVSDFSEASTTQDFENRSMADSAVSSPTSPPPPALTPFAKLVDLQTEAGRKYYIDATKELSSKFDGTKLNYHGFLLNLKDVANERGWNKICEVTVNNKIVNLLTEPGKISMTVLREHCKGIWASKNYPAQQLHNIMGQCLLKSVTVSVRNRLDLDKSSWFFPARGGNDGPIILKSLMHYSMQSTRYGIQTTKEALHGLTLASYGQNVTEMLIARRNLIDELAAHGEVFAEDLFWLYKSLETAKNKAFLRWLDGEKTLDEQGKATALSVEELQAEAETRYKNLVESKKWDDDSNEAKKIIALHAVVAELAKTVALQAKASVAQPKGDKNAEKIKEKNQWKYVAPKDNEDKTKAVGEKTYHWCPGQDGKAHKPMWCMHTPDSCSLEKSKEKKAASAPVADSAKSGQQKPKPTLQPNNSLQHALISLTKLFPGSNDAINAEGADAYGLDF
jgi:hypothetical protein